MSKFEWFERQRYPLLHEFIGGKDLFCILPWSLSIVDCYFTFLAMNLGSHAPHVRHSVRWEGDGSHSVFPLQEVYQIYEVDRSAGDQEVSLTSTSTGDGCYWDSDERFVLLAGTEAFLTTACPYPEEIERHRFVEASWEMGGMSDDELSKFYSTLKAGKLSAS